MNMNNTNSLKGVDSINRAMELMNLNESKSNKIDTKGVEVVKVGGDNMVYAIVRESNNFYIKRTPLTENVNVHDLEYLSGEARKNQNKFSSLPNAQKTLGLKLGNLNNEYGTKHNYENMQSNDIELDYSTPSIEEEMPIRFSGEVLNDELDFEVEDDSIDMDNHNDIEMEDDLFAEDDVMDFYQDFDNSIESRLARIEEILGEGLKKKV